MTAAIRQVNRFDVLCIIKLEHSELRKAGFMILSLKHSNKCDHEQDLLYLLE